MRQFNLIGISGKPGSRKDTLANAFIKAGRFLKGDATHLNYMRISLADQIRQVASILAGTGIRKMAEHPYKDLYVIPWFDMTPRKLTIGTGKAIEEHFGFEVWLHMAEREMANIQIESMRELAFVCTDIRTEVQANWIKRNNGLLIRLDNGVGELEEPIENMLDDFDFDIVYPSIEVVLDPQECYNKLVKYVKSNKEIRRFFH